jgi:hypothetical protein
MHTIATAWEQIKVKKNKRTKPYLSKSTHGFAKLGPEQYNTMEAPSQHYTRERKETSLRQTLRHAETPREE